MNGTLAQIAALVVMTHALRVLARLVGPRRCGLVLGLPSTTAVMLLACGQERGVHEALVTAETCLLGLIAVVSLVLVYIWVAGVAARLPWAPAVAVAGYVVMATALRWLPEIGLIGRIGLATVGVLGACRLTGRVKGGGGGSRRVTLPRAQAALLRTAVPVLLVVSIKAIRVVAGPPWAGLFLTFPAMSLAILIATHMEAGPVEARRMARALPRGNFGMIAFLAVFRCVGPWGGMAWGIACGYAAALATLLALEGLVWSPAPNAGEPAGRRSEALISRGLQRLARLGPPSRARGPSHLRRPRLKGKFFPLLEPIPG